MSRWLLIQPPMELIKPDEVKRLADPLSLLYVAAKLHHDGHEVQIFDFVAEGYQRAQTVQAGELVRPNDAVCAKPVLTESEWPRKAEHDEIHIGFDNLTEVKFGNILKEYQPDVVGISSMFTDQWLGAEWAAKHSGLYNDTHIVVFGGVNASMFLWPFYIDPIYRMALAWPKNWHVHHGPFDNGPDLGPEPNDPPIPAREILDWKPYWNAGQMYREPNRGKKPATVMFSRGCVANCTFCCSRSMMGYWKPYSNYRIEVELDQLKQLGMDELYIVDDCLTGSLTHENNNRIHRICRMIKDNGFIWYAANSLPIYSLSPEILDAFVQSGCYKITVSIETGTEETMKRIRKPVRLDKVKPLIDYAKSLGVKVESLFIVGFPWETKDDINRTIEFSQSLGLDYVSYPLATPFPGTDFYAECLKNGWLLPGLKLRDLKFGINNIKTEKWDTTWIEGIRRDAWRNYNA